MVERESDDEAGVTDSEAGVTRNGIPDWLDAKATEWAADDDIDAHSSSTPAASAGKPGGLSSGTARDTSHDPRTLSHVDARGQARMVDVSDKKDTKRTALAEGFVAMHPDTLAMIVEGRAAKGDVLATARVPIMGAKQTAASSPCAIPGTSRCAIELNRSRRGSGDGRIGIHVTRSDRRHRQDGIEMEELTATSVACLTIYDMCKAIDRGMEISEIHLLRKAGGKTGLWERGSGDGSISVPSAGERSDAAADDDRRGVVVGTVTSVNISERKGTRKHPVSSGTIMLRKDWGVEGDGHAGDWHRQVSLLARESIDKAVARGLDVHEGDFAENITTKGFVPYELPIGTRLRIGDTLLEISQIGKACHTRCAIYRLAGDCIFPREGIFTWVLEGGDIHVGDEIVVVSWGEGTCERTPQEALDEVAAFHAEECAKRGDVR